MRKHGNIALLCTALLCMFMLSACSGGVKTVEEMSDKVFAAVKANDKAAYSALVIPKSEMEALITKADMPAELRERELDNLDEEYKEVEDDLQQHWSSTFESMKAMGFDPAGMTLTKVDKHEETRKGTLGAEVELMVTSGGQIGTLAFTCLHNGGWYLLPNLSFHMESSTEEIEAH